MVRVRCWEGLGAQFIDAVSVFRLRLRLRLLIVVMAARAGVLMLMLMLVLLLWLLLGWFRMLLNGIMALPAGLLSQTQAHTLVGKSTRERSRFIHAFEVLLKDDSELVADDFSQEASAGISYPQIVEGELEAELASSADSDVGKDEEGAFLVLVVLEAIQRRYYLAADRRYAFAKWRICRFVLFCVPEGAVEHQKRALVIVFCWVCGFRNHELYDRRWIDRLSRLFFSWSRYKRFFWLLSDDEGNILDLQVFELW
jgi:hypothetical protein